MTFRIPEFRKRTDKIDGFATFVCYKNKNSESIDGLRRTVNKSLKRRESNLLLI